MGYLAGCLLPARTPSLLSSNPVSLVLPAHTFFLTLQYLLPPAYYLHVPPLHLHKVLSTRIPVTLLPPPAPLCCRLWPFFAAVSRPPLCCLRLPSFAAAFSFAVASTKELECCLNSNNRGSDSSRYDERRTVKIKSCEKYAKNLRA